MGPRSPGSNRLPKIGHVSDVLVTSSAQAHEDRLIAGPLPRGALDPGTCVGGLECGYDAFQAAENLEGVERLGVGSRLVGRPAGVSQIAVLRSDPGVVQPRRNRVGRRDWPSASWSRYSGCRGHAGRSGGERRAVMTGCDSLPAASTPTSRPRVIKDPLNIHGIRPPPTHATTV